MPNNAQLSTETPLQTSTENQFAARRRNHLSRFLLVLFILAALSRVLWLGDAPGGLNQDEASTGYDAWALLSEGIDRHGLSWPVHFISWGSGQNALYAYLAIPVFAIDGPTVAALRFPAALLGVMGLWIFWRLGRREDQQLAIWALLVIASSPWHLMVSRWALEANAAPPLVLLATYCFVNAGQNLRWLAAGSSILALTVYAYGPAYFFAPLFMLCAWVIVARQQKFAFSWFALSGVAAFLIALPIMAFLVNNSIGTGHLHWGPISIPKYPSEARYSGIFLPLAENGWSQIPQNANAVFQLLLGAQDDGLPWNASPYWGPQLWLLTPFLLLGFGYAFKGKKITDELMAAWLICALITACCTAANINRINLIWLPALWLSARGFWLLREFTQWNRIAQATLFLLGVIFALYYFVSWQKRITDNFFPGLGEALQTIQREAPSNEKLIVTQQSIYTNVLFYLRPNPHDYVKTADIPDPKSAFATVNGFSNVRFGINADTINNANFWVADRTELAQFPLPSYNIQTFGLYAAITRKPVNEQICYRPMDLMGFTGQQDNGTLSINQEVDNPYFGLPIANQTFYSGLGVHGDSKWSKPLDGEDESLEIGMGLSTNSNCSDGMTFRILLDDKLAFSSGKMTPGYLAFTKIPVKGAHKITLITDAGYNNRCDHGLWVTPTLKRCPLKQE